MTPKTPGEIADRWCGSAGCDAERVDPGFRHKTFTDCSLYQDIQDAIRAERKRTEEAEKKLDELRDVASVAISIIAGRPGVSGAVAILQSALRAGQGKP